MRVISGPVDLAKLVCESLDLVQEHELEVYMNRYEDPLTANAQFPCGTTCCILGHMTNLVCGGRSIEPKYKGPDTILEEIRKYVKIEDWMATKLDLVCSSMSLQFFRHRFTHEFGKDAGKLVDKKLEEIKDRIYFDDEPNEQY